MTRCGGMVVASGRDERPVLLELLVPYEDSAFVVDMLKHHRPFWPYTTGMASQDPWLRRITIHPSTGGDVEQDRGACRRLAAEWGWLQWEAQTP